MLLLLKLFYILQKLCFVSLTNNYGKANTQLFEADPHGYVERKILPVRPEILGN